MAEVWSVGAVLVVVVVVEDSNSVVSSVVTKFLVNKICGMLTRVRVQGLNNDLFF